MTTLTEIRVAAPAKLNLYLHVTGRRDDGYHELDSLVCFADIHDTVIARASDQLTFHVSGPYGEVLQESAGATGLPENLVIRAAKRLAELTNRAPHVHLELIKRLPIASGIGGGSADAAATLKALCRLWGITPSPTELHALAKKLGADVPVCLTGKSAYMGGIGEVLEKVSSLPKLGLVLINPGIPLETPPVFKARTGPFSQAARFSAAPNSTEEFIDLLHARHNDLMPPAISLAPVIGTVLEALKATAGCLLARMSGSGATCFGLYSNAAEAKTAAKALKSSHPQWWVAPGQLAHDCDKIIPA
jgi:4-diphosphocytidyl-2-C-methyl-D-erythritol kinase